ncbi:MAG: hypothetical protein WKG07_18225 [Hymenobacter sp.]
MKRLEAEGRTLNFYLHPWEADAHLPQVRGLAYSGTRGTTRGCARYRPSWSGS